MSTGFAGVEVQMEASCSLDVTINLAEPVLNILESQNELESLKALLAEREKEISQLKDMIDNNGASEDEIDSTSGNAFPDTVLLKIFDHLDNESLLHCRLVCKSMKSAIDNSSKLMRRFCFTIFGIHQFLDSTITTKVKNICFQRGLKGNQEDLALFFGEVGEAVESATFDFLQISHRSPALMKACHQSEADTVHRLLSNCKKLDTLVIASSNFAFLQYLAIKEDERFANVKNFVSTAPTITKEDITWLKPFLLSFPLLRSIEFSFESNVGVGVTGPNQPRPSSILSGLLMEHIQKYPGILKSISTNDALTSSLTLMAVMLKGYEIDFGEAHVDVNHFLRILNLVETAALTKVNYASLKRGLLCINNRIPLSNSDILRIHEFSSLERLQLVFETTTDNIQFLRQLPKLQLLKLEIRGTTPPLPLETFAFGLPNLNILQIHGNLFASAELAFATFYLWFPSLTVLQMTSVQDLPLDLMCFLRKMTKLKALVFRNCSISDTTFLRPCESIKDGSRGKKLIVPAIVALNLVHLKLLNCPLLTDVCLSSGIQYCSTLKYLTLESLGDQINQFTNLGVESVLDAGGLKLQQDFTKENVRSITFIAA